MHYRMFFLIALLPVVACAELPAPPKDGDLVDFPMTWTPDAPGAFDVAPLLDKPAGRLGPVVARDGHFYTGDQRIRFWGVNFCFSANFPTHEQADRVASRLAHFGVNAVRFHHMDNQKFPNGIFADAKLETLSEEALDRLDYLIAALKKNGVYSNLNLHVSRPWAKTHNLENADKLPESYDKIIDIFNPEIIKANKQYARDLLTHVNKYTELAYSADPAVCMVEINNENTLFLWGGEQAIAKLPEPYAGMLNKLWNDWLAKKYGSREKLATDWSMGAQPLGATNLLTGAFAVEAHGGAAMTVKSSGNSHVLSITKTGPNDWNAQFGQPKLKLEKGKFYTLTFTASADKARKLAVGASQAHANWQGLGLSSPLSLTTDAKPFRLSFIATETDDNARISFTTGQATGVVTLSDIHLREGGQEGLKEGESPFSDRTKSEVAVPSQKPGDSFTQSRKNDWYLFLQATDEAYWTDMRDFLKKELKVQAPIAGSIGIGPLGTLSQTKMDFVDAHSYWDHPRFPGKGWDPKNYLIQNKPMVDNPEGATFWKLAAIRVAGKPFTVTEYNHGVPNEWGAETIPLIATYAAMQDWDAVFLFAYSHSSNYERDHPSSFFDIEGDPLKMLAMPAGARIFMGKWLAPLETAQIFEPTTEQLLAHASPSYFEAWRLVGLASKFTWKSLLAAQFATRFPSGEAPAPDKSPAPQTLDQSIWTAHGAGTGQFCVSSPHSFVFVGFGPVKPAARDAEAPIKLERLDSPFAAITVVPAGDRRPGHYLLTAASRATNTGTKWNEARTTVSTDWGKAPTRIETVKATFSLAADYTVRALDSRGTVIKEFKTTDKTLKIGDVPAVWYELIRN